MTKEIKVIITTSVAIVLAIVIGMVVMKSRAKSNRMSNKPVPTIWNNTAMMVSPFTAVRFDGDNVLVTYAGAEYQLSAINEVATADILQFSRDAYHEGWQKRIAEDLLVVLGEMGHPVDGNKVSLSLIDPATGQRKDIPEARMTSENRSLIHRAMAPAAATLKQAQ